jgi:UDP-N-acetylmuramate dehydrogenase
MNAGSHGRSVDSILETVTLMAADGRVETLGREQLRFKYRTAELGGRVVLEAAFRLPEIPREATRRTLDEYRDHRARTQDLQHASAGCMFKNPSEGVSSGRLIDEAGLKGRTIGRAQVSQRHANFIINLGGATARDVRELIEEVQRTVHEKFGVYLETEVKIL